MLNHKGTSKVTSTSKNISINHYNGSESESYYSNQHLSGNYSDADEDDEENEGTENNLEDDSRSETSKNSNIIIQSLLET
jgi:hypothetical protein